MGATDGISLGMFVGMADGLAEGTVVVSDGLVVGEEVVGATVWSVDGTCEAIGRALIGVGGTVGVTVGVCVGGAVGVTVGTSEGRAVGTVEPAVATLQP